MRRQVWGKPVNMQDDMARRSGDEVNLTNDAVLRELSGLAERRKALMRTEVILTTMLRERGLDWDEIAWALGVTRQAASARYKRLWEKVRDNADEETAEEENGEESTSPEGT